MGTRTGVACACVLWLAGCAVGSGAADADRLSREIVRLTGVALATASSGDDVRAVLGKELRAGPGDRMVRIAGHRFIVVPATLDIAAAGADQPAGRYPWLLAQSFELAEQVCLPFRANGAVWQPTDAADPAGTLTLAAWAEQVQRVTVGIELHHGCIVALHVEQASAKPRD
jgi:hypothetical protein